MKKIISLILIGFCFVVTPFCASAQEMNDYSECNVLNSETAEPEHLYVTIAGTGTVKFQYPAEQYVVGIGGTTNVQIPAKNAIVPGTGVLVTFSASKAASVTTSDYQSFEVDANEMTQIIIKNLKHPQIIITFNN